MAVVRRDKSRSINAKRVDPEAALERSKARKRFIDDALRATTGYAELEVADGQKSVVQSEGGGQKKD